MRSGEWNDECDDRQQSLAAALGLILAACGSDSNNSSDTTAGGGAATTAGGGGRDDGRRRGDDRRCGRAAARSASPGTTTRKSAGRSGTSRRSRRPIEAGGGKYISNDAKSSAETQASNVENLISQGANVLIILAQDGTAIKPSVASAIAERRAGHRLRPPDRGSGRALHHVRQRRGGQARGGGRVQGRSRRATTSSSRATRPTPTPTSCAPGTTRSSRTRSPRATSRSSARPTPTTGIPSKAQTETEQFLTAANNDVQAVLSENDGMAGGVVAALDAQGLAGKVPVSGQDGDQAALNRVALGTQTVSVWKDARELGKSAGESAIAAVQGQGRQEGRRHRGRSPPRAGSTLSSILLTPQPITKDNLNVVIDAGWIDQGQRSARASRPVRSPPAAEPHQ